MIETCWGIYCPQHYGSWLTKNDGMLVFYPSKKIAEAYLESVLSDPLNHHLRNSHLWTVVEFGKQEYVDPRKAPPQTVMCPSTRSLSRTVSRLV